MVGLSRLCTLRVHRVPLHMWSGTDFALKRKIRERRHGTRYYPNGGHTPRENSVAGQATFMLSLRTF